MSSLTQFLLIAVVLADFYVLASSSLDACIRAVALQGMALGLVPLALHHGGWSFHTFLISAGMVGLKGFVVPWLLFRAMREAARRREVEPMIGFATSLLLGAGLVGLGFYFAGKLPLPPGTKVPMLVPVGLATAMIGLLVIVSRMQALTQVLGYLMLENGIFAFGLTLSEGLPGLIEMGVLLDLFVGVFVMGIVIHHINLEFDSMSTRHLSTLKE